MKVLIFLSCVISTNSCLLISSTLVALGKASAAIYDLQVSFFAPNSQSPLLNDRKSMLNTISMLVSANQKIVSKNQALFFIISKHETIL